jgi:hypothetical protein
VSTTNVPKTQVLWSPRVGVNWDVTGDQTTQIRGNVGVFTGPPPLIIIANAYQNTGTQLVFLNCGGGGAAGIPATPAFTTDVNALPRACVGGTTPAPGTAGTAGINVNDPNFKYPQNFTATLGFDRRLPFGVVFSGEALYRKAINGLFITDANLKGPRMVNGQVYTDVNGRYLYADTISATGGVTNTNQRYITRIGANNVNFTEGAILVTNQSKDYSYSLSGQLRKRWGATFEANGAYTYTQAKDAQSLTSDRAISNFRNGTQTARNVRDLDATTSYFERPHRVIASGTYTAPWKSFPTDVSVFYEGISGTPFMFTVNGDINGDLVSGNDPIYVPTSAADAQQIRVGSSS